MKRKNAYLVKEANWYRFDISPDFPTLQLRYYFALPTLSILQKVWWWHDLGDDGELLLQLYMKTYGFIPQIFGDEAHWYQVDPEDVEKFESIARQPISVVRARVWEYRGEVLKGLPEETEVRLLMDLSIDQPVTMEDVFLVVGKQREP